MNESILRSGDPADLMLRIALCKSFEKQYPAQVDRIDRSFNENFPPDVDLFILGTHDQKCTHEPPCEIEVIALHCNGVSAFLSDMYYDRIEEVIENIRSKANANSDTTEQSK